MKNNNPLLADILRYRITEIENNESRQRLAEIMANGLSRLEIVVIAEIRAILENYDDKRFAARDAIRLIDVVYNIVLAVDPASELKTWIRMIDHQLADAQINEARRNAH